MESREHFALLVLVLPSVSPNVTPEPVLPVLIVVPRERTPRVYRHTKIKMMELPRTF
jgi:hypothetical protein